MQKYHNMRSGNRLKDRLYKMVSLLSSPVQNIVIYGLNPISISISLDDISLFWSIYGRNINFSICTSNFFFKF